MDIQASALASFEEVELSNVLAYYRKTDYVHQTVFDLCRSDHDNRLFSDSLKHDLRIIRSRSQDLKDHELNIYQKAFVMLMSNKEDHVAGIGLYVEEILGLKLLRETEKKGALRLAIETRRLVTEKFDIEGSSESYGSNKCSILRSQEGALHQLESLNFELPSQLQETDPKLYRLWNLCQSAKKDFLSTPESEWRAHTSSAKFLRDTAENCINYLESKQHPNQDRADVVSSSGTDNAAPVLNELRIIVTVAKDAAEKGSGGKKRRFDHNMEGVPREPRRMRAETARKLTSSHTPVPNPQKPRSDERNQRQHIELRGRGDSQDYAGHLAALAHSRELRMAQMDRERSASPKHHRADTFDERDYPALRSRVHDYELSHHVSDRQWRRSEAEDYHSSCYKSGDRLGRPRSEDHKMSYSKSLERQEKPRAEGYTSSYHGRERQERPRIADTWRPPY